MTSPDHEELDALKQAYMAARARQRELANALSHATMADRPALLEQIREQAQQTGRLRQAIQSRLEQARQAIAAQTGHSLGELKRAAARAELAWQQARRQSPPPPAATLARLEAEARHHRQRLTQALQSQGLGQDGS